MAPEFSSPTFMYGTFGSSSRDRAAASSVSLSGASLGRPAACRCRAHRFLRLVLHERVPAPVKRWPHDLQAACRPLRGGAIAAPARASATAQHHWHVIGVGPLEVKRAARFGAAVRAGSPRPDSSTAPGYDRPEDAAAGFQEA